jgi:hypothetical protein
MLDSSNASVSEIKKVVLTNGGFKPRLLMLLGITLGSPFRLVWMLPWKKLRVSLRDRIVALRPADNIRSGPTFNAIGCLVV